MAKGNMLLGYARGKVGSLVFSRRKGEQVTRARNMNPTNPRTNLQMSQRMKMYAPVKFYRQSMANFFKYAFPVKAKETVFNAYIRENIANAPWTSKNLAAAGAPVPFPVRMSSGGAPQIAIVQDADGLNPVQYGATAYIGGTVDAYLGVGIPVADMDSPIATFSENFLAANPQFSVGDQLTFLVVYENGLSIENGDVLYDGASAFNFAYKKIVLDPTNQAGIATVLDAVEHEGVELCAGVRIRGNYDTDAVGGCVIVTRTNGAQVDASNSTLFLNTVAEEIYNLMRTDAYKEKALMTYKSTDEPYLLPEIDNQ